MLYLGLDHEWPTARLVGANVAGAGQDLVVPVGADSPTPVNPPPFEQVGELDEVVDDGEAAALGRRVADERTPGTAQDADRGAGPRLERGPARRCRSGRPRRRCRSGGASADSMTRGKKDGSGLATPQSAEVAITSVGRSSARSSSVRPAGWLPTMPTRRPAARSRRSEVARASG